MGWKVKYDYAFRLEYVKLVLKSHYSCEWVSKEKGPNKSNIRKWTGFYSRFGKTGFLPRKNQNYSTDFKLKVFKYIDNNYLSLKGTCLKFNITSESVIIKW